MKLSASMSKLSCVNDSRSHLVEHITQCASERLGLPEVRPGRSWVTLCLTTSPGKSWLIYARYASESAYPENNLCIQHAIVRGAVINGNREPPRMKLQDSVFELHRRVTTNLDGPLYPQLRLQPCGLSIRHSTRHRSYPGTTGFITRGWTLPSEVTSLALPGSPTPATCKNGWITI